MEVMQEVKNSLYLESGLKGKIQSEGEYDDNQLPGPTAAD